MQWLIKILKLYLKHNYRPSKWNPPEIPSTIAVLCYGGIGDILMCTPAIRAVKETFPHCRIVAVVHYKKEAILKNNPYIDRLLSGKKRIFRYFSLYLALRKEKPEVAILFHSNDALIYTLFHQVCPGKLVGLVTNNPMTFLLNKTMQFDESRHVIENNLKLMGLIGANSDDKRMNLQSDLDAEIRAKKILRPLAEKPFLVGFQLGANFAGKCWAPENFSALGQRLIAERRVGLAIFGSPADQAKIEIFCRQFGSNAIAVTRDLETASAVIKCLNLFVTPDTGPMHMALALNCPTIALFGPTSPKNFGPLTSCYNSIVIHKAELSQPALKIRNDPEDRMGKISVEEVCAEAVKLLSLNE